jgi:aryl-alcohol dehydrogenase-like predicted oxidoreductase
MQQIDIRPGHSISRVIRGNWQLATGHGPSRTDDPVADLCAYADAGITAFDCADIYTGVEETIGRFRAEYGRTRGSEALARIKVHTKLVPDLDILGRITKQDVETIIDRSLKRLGTDMLDLVQFHWWDYAEPRWLETALWLTELRTAGKIRNIGGTNFDTAHVAEMVEAGVPLASMQVQYSLLDRRPEKSLVDLARQHDIKLLGYGTVAGGFLSDRWLGAPAPSGADENRSLTKYRLIIEDWGGWGLFQELLATLRAVADRHGTDIATVASAAMLPRPQVAAVIVGARDRSHLPQNLAIGAITLSEGDMAEIDAVLAKSTPLDGDVYTLERDRHGRHGRIMKYNLNDAPGASQKASSVGH